MLTAVLNAMILLPFIFFFLPASRINDRHHKPKVIRFISYVLLVLMLLGVVAFITGYFWLAFLLTLLLATQSAVYSPAKLGYLKSLFGESRLTVANSIAQALVVLAILISTVIFSVFFEWRYVALGGVESSLARADQASQALKMMTPLVLTLLGLAVLQLVLARHIAADLAGRDRASLIVDRPRIEATLGEVTEPALIRVNKLTKLLSTSMFIVPVAGMALFWSVGQGLLAVFPAYAKAYLAVDSVATVQGIMACAALGIIAGAAGAGLGERRSDQLTIAIMGIAILLFGVAALLITRSILAVAVVYLLLGIGSGMLIVPLNSYLQRHTPVDMMGSVIAASNFLQNIAMLVTLLTTFAFAYWGLPSAALIVGMGVFMVIFGVPIAVAIWRLKSSPL